MQTHAQLKYVLVRQGCVCSSVASYSISTTPPLQLSAVAATSDSSKSTLVYPMLLLLAVLLLAAALSVLLFGDSPTVRHTAIHRLHRHLSRAVDALKAFLAVHNRMYALLCWAVPVFYVLVVFLCVGWYFLAVEPLVPGEIRHTLSHRLLVVSILASVAISSVLVTFTDPGYITAENLDVHRYRDNHLIFFGRRCDTCRLPRPARAKHCSVCGHCVALFDHHCLWVNNCIGYRNYPWFMVYLVLNLAMMWYGAYLCWNALSWQKNLGWWQLITKTSHGNRIAGTLLLVAVLLLVVTAVFAALHVRYLYLGVTTNEAEKWSEIEYLVERGLLYYVRDMDVYVEKAVVRDDSGSLRVYLNLADDVVRFDESDEDRHEFVQIQLVETDLVNIYDRGFWGNIRERVFLL